MASRFTEGSHRFSDVDGEPQRRLPPLRGFETMPLVTLEEATQPLIPHVAEIEHMVHTVKEDNKKPADGLTVDESASISLYSLEWSPSQNSFYLILNSMLRSPSRQDNLPPWLLYLRLFITALSKLPSTPCRTIYRGVKMDLRDKYIVGAAYVWWGFSSCTSSIDVLKNDQFFGQSGARTLFSIECDTGKSILNHAFFHGENEILLLPGREVKVIGCLPMGNEVHMIQLVEIEPRFPHIASIAPTCLPDIGNLSVNAEAASKSLPKAKVPESYLSAAEPATHVELSYQGRGLVDADIQRVMQEALVEKRCTSLNLRDNKIADKGADTIATTIQNNKVGTNL